MARGQSQIWSMHPGTVTLFERMLKTRETGDIPQGATFVLDYYMCRLQKPAQADKAEPRRGYHPPSQAMNMLEVNFEAGSMLFSLTFPARTHVA